MPVNETQLDGERLREVLRRERVFYEIYPDLTWQPADWTLTWFELALHAETEYKPPTSSGSREVFSVLMDLAEFLIQRIRSQAPYQVDLSASYYTLHPPGRGGEVSRTRLSRSHSLVFFDIDPYRRLEEPVLLTQLKAHLSLLDISRLKVDRFD